MKRVRIWAIRAGMGLLVLLILLGGAGVWFVRRPWPQTSGTITALGLSAPVQVLRDSTGVPNIYAQNEHDLFFAQGYVHAQDRLWQMEFNRRLISGTVSEFAGKDTVEVDRYMRTWGLRRLIEQNLATFDSDSRAILQAYAEGVNAYVNSHRSSLPLEFTILGVDPKPWTEVDCLLWGNFMAIHLAPSYDLFRAKMVAAFGEQTAEQLLPPYSKDTPMIVPEGDYAWLREAQSEAKRLGLTRLERAPLGVTTEPQDLAALHSSPLKGLTSTSAALIDLSFGWGSGVWAIGGKHTQSGGALLANDAHMTLTMPSMWYENGLHGGRFDVVGFSFPGVPLVALGHNQRIAWGYSVMDADDSDLYFEKLDHPTKPTQYEFMGAWHPVDVVHETINVKGGDPMSLDVYFTRHGPLVNSLWGVTDQQPMALRSPVFEGSLVFQSIVRLNLAQNWDQFRTALQKWETLSLNFVYADVDGNIGYQAAGRIPRRVPKHTGVAPVEGWGGEYEWQGYIPQQQLPSVLNPPSGFVVAANNKVYSDNYPYLITYDWFHEGYRAKRVAALIQKRIEAKQPLTPQDMRDIQADTYSYPAEILRAYLTALKPENALQSQALEYVKTWDLHYEQDSVGASIYETWFSFMIENTFADELKRDNMKDYSPIKRMLALINFMDDENSIWFDDTATTQHETRDDIMRRSLVDALAWLSQRYGEKPEQWEWQKMHTVTMPHMAFNGVPFLKDFYNSKRYAFPGSDFSVNLAFAERGDQGFTIAAAAQQRDIIDLGDWDSMLASNSTGQNANIFHPQREDQTPAWRDKAYHPMPFSRKALEQHAAAVLTLTP